MDPRKPNEPGPPEADPDDLLEEVARIARDDEMAEAERMDRLRRLAADELTDGELAELRAEAETSDDAARDLEAFRPLGEEFHERIIARLQDGSRAPKEREAEVVTLDRARVRRAGRSAGRRTWTWPALAAAALVTVLLGPWLYRQTVAPALSFPGYSMELSGEIQDTRGEAGPSEELPEFGPGSILRLTLSPDVDPQERPDFTFYFADEQGELFEWDRFTRDGAAARLEESVEDLGLAPGSWTVYFVYGRPGKLPSPRSAADLEDESKNWQTASRRLRVVPGDPAAAELPLEVLYFGCSEAKPGPVCIPGDRLTLWVRSEARADIRVAVDDRTIEDRVATDGGWRYRIGESGVLEAAASEVVATAEAGSRRSEFRLQLAPSELAEGLLEARRNMSREELEERLADSDDESRAFLAGALARRLNEEASLQSQLLELAVGLHRDQGQVREMFWDLGMLFYLQSRDGRFDLLRQRLDEIGPPAPDWPAEAHLVVTYYRGVLEHAVGNLRGSLSSLKQAVDVAERVDTSLFRHAAVSNLAFVLQDLARGPEADLLLVRTTSEPSFDSLPPCTRAEILTTHSWVRLLAESELGSPLPILDRAEAASHGQRCGTLLQINLGMNRAMALAQIGHSFEARRTLADIESMRESLGALHQLWWHDLEARLALEENEFGQALASSRRMEELADLAYVPGARVRSNLRQADALERLGRPTEALDAYGAAEALLDERSLQVPLAGGRAEFTARTALGVQRYLDLLLRQGADEEALAVARRSRTRLLRTIQQGHRLSHLSPQQQLHWDRSIARYQKLRDEIEAEARDDWQLSAAELPATHRRRAEMQTRARRALDQAFSAVAASAGAGTRGRGIQQPGPRPGETLLAYHPLPEGWAGFAARDDQVTSRRIELKDVALSDPQQSRPQNLPRLADLLLKPFAVDLEASTHVRVLAYGALHQVDFHALPWNGSPLLATKTLTYGLDLEPTMPAEGSRSRPRRALIVSNSRLDLPAARQEAESVVDALLRSSQFSEVNRLEGGQATVEALRRRLPAASLFHLAGHGTRDSGARDNGARDNGSDWSNGLPMAEGRNFGLGEILSLEQAPEVVVLSSCDGARGDLDPAAGLGLAQAFLLSGTSRVIASVRPVGDRESQEFFRQVYGAPFPEKNTGFTDELVQRVRRTQLAWHARDPDSPWATIRVLEP